MSDGQPQVPVEKICGAVSSEGRKCLKIKGHKNWWHQHGFDIWQSSEEEREGVQWTVSEKLRDALNEASTEEVKEASLFALVAPEASCSPLLVALHDWLDEIATIKEEGGAE